jgi:hypothetical protein
MSKLEDASRAARVVDARPATGLATVVGGARHAVRRVVGRHPAIYLPIARRRHHHGALRDDTEIVIDGFTRSAVTFAVIAFQLAQNGHVRVAHHLHVPAHLLAGIRRGIPVLTPIRAPEDTILSAMIREPDVPAVQWLRSYVDFYRRLVPLAGRIVLAPFESVTTDFGSVTHRVNERFGTSFVEFKHAEVDVDTVLDLIEERASRPPWQPLLGEFLAGILSYDEYRELTAGARATVARSEVPEDRVQRPSADRQARKAALRGHYRAPGLARLRARAERAFEQVALLA